MTAMGDEVDWAVQNPAPTLEPDTITVSCCGMPGCGHKELGAMFAGSGATCPTHRTPLMPVLYERVMPPAPKKGA